MALLSTRRAHRAVSILVMLGLLGVVSAQAADTILVLKSRDVPQYTEAVGGFTQQWQSCGASAAVVTATLGDASDDLLKSMFGTNQPAAVVAVGTEAARWAIQHTTGPVVFCMAANAEQSVLPQLSDADRGRVFGVALNVPVKTQFQLVRELMPAVKRVGVLFDPKKSSAAVEEARAAAAGLGLELVTQEVASGSALPGAVDLIAPRIDLLWAPVDSTVFSSRNAEFVLSQMLRRKVPVMGFSENMVKAGALFAPRVGYASLGGQTADLLDTAMRANSWPGGTIQQPAKWDFVVNERICNLLGQPFKPSSTTATYYLAHED